MPARAAGPRCCRRFIVLRCAALPRPLPGTVAMCDERAPSLFPLSLTPADYVKEIFVDAGAPRELIRRHHYSIRFIPLPMAFNDEVPRPPFPLHQGASRCTLLRGFARRCSRR